MRGLGPGGNLNFEGEAGVAEGAFFSPPKGNLRKDKK